MLRQKVLKALRRVMLRFLTHVERELPGGGLVLVLNTGAAITPEDEAMTQALHSRSLGGVLEHLKKLVKIGSQKFMSTFYVGYGHRSIGDCGSTTIFIEGVSMLAAKAIQDWPLYSGQEASTRYIDFAEQPFIDPIGTYESRSVLETWREFYLYGLDIVINELKQRYPQQNGEKGSAYKKAIKARAFDIMRGFLPAGASTNLAWHTNLRQAADKLLLLRHHPLQEVRDIAEALESALLEAFPNSFSDKRYEATERYNELLMRECYYYTTEHCPEFAVRSDAVDRELLASYRQLLNQRPAKTELPKHIKECGTLQFQFLLDFGSFRDLQRQRAVTQRMPLLGHSHGFAEWYLNELPEQLRVRAQNVLKTQRAKIDMLHTSNQTAQYYIAMGYNTPQRLTGDLHALVYLVELRATRFVHPTLRHRAQQIAGVLEDRFGEYGLVLHLDDEPDRFDVRRGQHDIVMK